MNVSSGLLSVRRCLPVLVIALTLSCLCPAANAQTQYSSLVSFQAATSTTRRSTFESFSEGIRLSPLTGTGVSYTPVTGQLYTAVPGGPASSVFGTTLQSVVLTAEGNENFDITFPGLNPTAVGFDVYTNNATAPLISVFNTSSALIGQFSVSSPINSFGFFGIVTTVPIGRINYLATNGGVINTGIDNVRIGVSAAAPETGTMAFFVLGMGFSALGAEKLPFLFSQGKQETAGGKPNP
jgi:hypothetical protein